MPHTRAITLALIALAPCILAAPAAAQYLGPTPYLSRADSPFAGPGFSFFRLEDLEDNLLNTTGLSASAGVLGSPGPATDSVDGDDGLLNNSGTAARSWYIGSTNTVRFTFDAAIIGAYPTRAGLVWTDVGTVSSGAFATTSVTFEAFDAAGVSLGIHGPFTLGDGQIAGQTAEDRFFGIIHDPGLSAITLTCANTTDWELDHIQYGIPGLCRADLTTSAVPGTPGYGQPNGILDNDDFFYYLAQLGLANLQVCDLTTTALPGTPGYGIPNGVLNNDDFFFYLTLYVAGC